MRKRYKVRKYWSKIACSYFWQVIDTITEAEIFVTVNRVMATKKAQEWNERNAQ
jgi:hypothetical protein